MWILACLALIQHSAEGQEIEVDHKMDVDIEVLETVKPTEERVYEITELDKPAAFPGGSKAMFTFIANNISYPEVVREQNIQGTVFLSFVVDAEGNLKNIQVLKSPNKLLTDESIRVLKLMPSWEAGELKENKVSMRMRLPIKFKLDGAPVEKSKKVKKKKVKTPVKDQKPRTKVLELHELSEIPRLREDYGKLNTYVYSQIEYPPIARENEIVGVVMCKFVIDEAGSVSNIETIDPKLGYGLEEEAKRIIQSLSGKFSSPIDKKGNPTKCYYRIPIKFELI